MQSSYKNIISLKMGDIDILKVVNVYVSHFKADNIYCVVILY
jgi:hypothetical protein